MKTKQNYSDFSKGYNTKDDPNSVVAGQVASLKNAYPLVGSPKPREGASLFSPTPLTSDHYKQIPYESDTLGKCLIVICVNGEFWLVQENGNSNYLIYTTTSTTKDISYVYAADAIFLFSEDDAYNLILEEELQSPYFNVRSNFIHNFNDGNPTIQESHWSVYSDYLENDLTRDALPDRTNSVKSGSTNNLSYNANQSGYYFVNQYPDLYMYRAWAITMVRRTDDKAFESDGVTPKLIETFLPGDIESDLDLLVNSRVLAIPKDPLNLASNVIHYADFSNTGATTVLAGEYVYHDEEILYYKALVNTTANVDLLVGSGDYILYPIKADGYGNNGDCSFRVDLPRKGGSTLLEASDLDPSITHFRIYSTQSYTTPEEAKGAPLRFVADVPVQDAFTDMQYDGNTVRPFYLDENNDAVLSGSDNLPSTIGVGKPPRGGLSHYHKGLIWVGGDPSAPGKWFSSKVPNSAVDIKKFLTMFQVDLFYVDSTSESKDTATGINSTGDFLLFINDRSVYGLYGGDQDSELLSLSKTRGCPFPKTITSINDTVYFMSNDGPAIVNGRTIELIDAFAAGEFWPKTGSNEVLDNMEKTIFQIEDNELGSISSFYSKSTWFTSYQYETIIDEETVLVNKLIGFYNSPVGRGIGAFEIDFANENLNFVKEVSVYSDGSIVAYLNSNDTEANKIPYRILDKRESTDLGENFIVSGLSQRIYADPENMIKSMELYDILLFVEYNDQYEMSVKVIVDDEHQIANGVYDNEIIDNENQLKIYRNNIQYGFPQGIFGNFMQVEFVKVYDSKFSFRGFDIRYLMLNGAIPKFTTTDSQILIDFNDEGVGVDLIEDKYDPLIVYPKGTE